MLDKNEGERALKLVFQRMVVVVVGGETYSTNIWVTKRDQRFLSIHITGVSK